MNLWLDDIREPWKFGCTGWEWAKTAEEAIALLKTGKVEKAYLDHDLTEEQMYECVYGVPATDGQKSGYDVVRWLEEHPEFWPKEGVVVHSMNPAGRSRMQQVIDRHYKGEDNGN
jgi:hypothetical protein